MGNRTFADSEAPDQPAYLHSLIRVIHFPLFCQIGYTDISAESVDLGLECKGALADLVDLISDGMDVNADLVDLRSDFVDVQADLVDLRPDCVG